MRKIQRLTPPGSTLKCVPAKSVHQPTRVDVEDHTECQVKVDPSRNEHAIKVPMSDDKDVTSAFILLEILAVILMNLCDLSWTSGQIYRSA